MYQTMVVGGGAAGMMAAIAAAELGERVVLLEGNDRLGRKILISGNGRCNLTNKNADVLKHYHCSFPTFVKPALEAFTMRDTLKFFARMGIQIKEEKRGRLFPQSDQAQAIVDVFEERLSLLGVDVCKGEKIKKLTCGETFDAASTSGEEWSAKRAILASGGMSLNKLGADRSGIDLAVDAGHTCTNLYPGLVALESSDPYIPRMQGSKIWAEVRAVVTTRRTLVDIDDLLFTKYGISGFTVLNLSAQLVPLLEKGAIEVNVNLLPGKTAEQVSEILKERWQQNPHRTLGFSFTGLLSNKIVPPLLQKLGFEAKQKVGKINKNQRWKLAQGLVGLPIVVTGPRSFDFAEVTIGGIEVREIDPYSMQSYIVPGLYLVGEMLAVHGDLGGFNFQWAWSSGHLAGACGIS